MIRIGIAGWDYPDWNGIVYPAQSRRGFDRLAHVARFVDVIEINSSFYRPVAPRVAESWVRRTEHLEGFLFTAKAHRSWTHERVGDLSRTVAETLDGLRPLERSGRLGALLVQFPQSFHHGVAAVAHLGRILERTEGWPTVFEVRHRSWEAEEALAWFRENRAGWCAVDQPRLGATAGCLSLVTTGIGYLRMHGRNAGNWFRADAGRDGRYDYLYSPAELDEVAGPVRSMASRAAEMFVIQNNHFRGQALANALQWKHLLQEPRPLAPEDLVAHYPQLERAVTVRRTKLF